jgi:hypothetical protein
MGPRKSMTISLLRMENEADHDPVLVLREQGEHERFAHPIRQRRVREHFLRERPVLEEPYDACGRPEGLGRENETGAPAFGQQLATAAKERVDQRATNRRAALPRRSGSMTLADISAMFHPGQVWIGKRTPGFKGEPHTTTYRKVREVLSNQIVFQSEGKPYRTTLPKASEVLEARPGYLRFSLPFVNGEVELCALDPRRCRARVSSKA